jgi:hypothetical protein
MSEAQQAELMPPEKKNGKLAKREQAIAPATPMGLIEMAVGRGASVDELRELMKMKFEYEANEARKAFVAAMNAFKAEAAKVIKNKKASFNQTSWEYASLDNLCETLAPILSKHGLAHRWDIAQNEGKIRVTCVLTHELGHSESAMMEAGADTSGSKNAIQAIGSSITYLQKYTFFAVTGTAAKGTDTDGVAPTLDGIDDMLKAISEAPDTSALKMVYTAAYNKAKLAKNQQAELLLIAAKDKRKAELTADDAA